MGHGQLTGCCHPAQSRANFLLNPLLLFCMMFLIAVAFSVIIGWSSAAKVVDVNGVGVDLDRVPADPDVGLDIVQLVTKRGYPIETHYATTRDGYILTLFRIPHGVRSAAVGNPVILQHGLLDSSYTWVSNFANESLSYLLADHGYDVWMGNNRGNRYGRNHTTLAPEDAAFWQFSWDAMAAEDVPTLINYVTTFTGKSTTSWVGHSEGTIQMFAAGSSQSADAFLVTQLAKLNLFVALAPVAYVNSIGSKIMVGLARSDVLQRMQARGVVEFLPYGPIEKIAPEICQMGEQACNAFLMAICGPTRAINASRIQVYVSNTPAGTSLQNMAHWAQGILGAPFAHYDYGTDGNMAKYGQATAPLYNLSSMTVRTALFAGSHDYLADPKDVGRMIEELPADKVVFSDTTNLAHLDYVWAPSAATEVYGKVIQQIDKYTK